MNYTSDSPPLPLKFTWRFVLFFFLQNLCSTCKVFKYEGLWGGAEGAGLIVQGLDGAPRCLRRIKRPRRVRQA